MIYKYSLVFFVLFLSIPTLATERYALQENANCTACHYNPSGGGPLNIKGRYYQRHDLSLEGFTEYLASLKETLKKKKEVESGTPTTAGIVYTALDRLSIQGSVRSSFTYTFNRQLNVARDNFDLLDATLAFGMKVHEKLNIIYATELNNLHASDVFIKADGPNGTFLQIGQFTTPYGLNSDDPTIMVRSLYGLQYFLKDIGVIIGYQQSGFFLNGSILNGYRHFSSASQGIDAIGDPFRGVSVTGNIGFQTTHMILGTSGLIETTGNVGDSHADTEALMALYASLSLLDRLHLSGEIDFGFKKGIGTGSRTGLRPDSSPRPVKTAASSFVEPFYGKISPQFGNQSMGAFGKLTYELIPKKWDIAAQYDMLSGNANFLGDAPIRITGSSKVWFWKNFSIEPQFKYNLTPPGSAKNAPASQIETARRRNKHQFLIYARASF